jgi:hypothetical protein
MTLRGEILKTVFAGAGSPWRDILLQLDDGTSPNGVTTAPQGTWLVVHYNGDNSDGDVYLNTDGSTTWVQVYNAV